MKERRRLLIICAVFTAILLQLFARPPSDNQRNNSRDFLRENAAYFPKALELIGDEAFEGTAFQTLVFEEGLLQIGEHAFSETNQLEEVYFPETVDYIADNAFYCSSLETVYGSEGSYIQSWAAEHYLDFKPTVCWFTGSYISRISVVLLTTMLGVICPLPENDAQRIKRYLIRTIISMRPQDRPELNPIDYRFP